jgi:hypothetical protein
VSPEEWKERDQRSALFKTMFLAFRAAGAKDRRLICHRSGSLRLSSGYPLLQRTKMRRDKHRPSKKDI